MRYCLDTGVLLRVFCQNDSYYSGIRHALRTISSSGGELVTTAQNLAEFWNVWTRPASSRGGFGQSLESANRHVGLFLRFGPPLTESPSSFAIWQRLVVDYSVQGVAVHDARLVAIMLVNNATHILTLNPDDFLRYPEVVAVTPETFSTTGGS